MKFSYFDSYFAIDPNTCTGMSLEMKKYLEKALPEKYPFIGKEIDKFTELYNKYLLGEIVNYKSEWSRFVNIDIDKVPDSIFNIDGRLISLSYLDGESSVYIKNRNEIYYESTFRSFTNAYHKLIKDFCHVEMEPINTYYSYIILKDRKIKVNNIPFVEAFYQTVKLYYNPKEWQRLKKDLPHLDLLESFITKFIASSIGYIDSVSKEEQKFVKFLCSLMLLEEKRIKSGFYKNVA